MDSNSVIAENSVVGNDVFIEMVSQLDTISSQLNLLNYSILFALGLTVAGLVIFILYKIV